MAFVALFLALGGGAIAGTHHADEGLDADRFASAAELTGEGTAVRYLDTIFLRGDEACLHLLEASCEADVRAAAERAAIEVDRIVLAEQIDPRREEKS